MIAKQLLEELTELQDRIPGTDSGSIGPGHIMAKTYPITGMGGVVLGSPSTVVQREVLIKGQRFLVQVISLAE